MKKLLIAVLIALTCACGAAALSSCARKDEHTHSFGEWTSVTEATCTEKGTEKRTCECGYSEERETDELGHSWQYTHAQNSDEHSHTKSCARCDIAPTAESCTFTDNVITPDCMHGGYIEHVCTACEYGYRDNETGPTDHVYGAWKHVDDTATHMRTCLNANCGHSETESCTYDTEDVPATCTSAGYTKNTCRDCEYYFESAQVDKLPHAYGGWTYAHTDSEGRHIHQRVCGYGCGATETDYCTETNPVVTEPTCRSGGWTTYTCEVCNVAHTADPKPIGEHSWGTWTVGTGQPLHHERVCSVCDLHSYGLCSVTTTVTDADCENDGVTVTECSVCDRHTEVTSPKLGHDYPDEWTHNEGVDTHSRTCRRPECGNIETDDCEMERKVNPYTCTTDETITESCLYCSNSRTESGEPAPGHSWGQWTHDSGKETHTHTCYVCRATQTEECNYNITEIPADCTNVAKIRKECDACQNTVTEDKPDSKAYGHLIVQVEEPTATHHHVRCDRPGCDFEHDGAHEYYDTNYCLYCNRDGLEYKLDASGTYYIVLHDSNIKGARRIIIPETYNGYPVREIASGITTTNGSYNGFYNNKDITELVLPETLETIGDYAFESCTNLKAVTVTHEDDGDEYHPSLREIGDHAFGNCSSLRSAANLPATLKLIGDYAFSGCSRLAEITIPDGVETIGDHAFYKTAYRADRTHWTEGALYIGRHLIAFDGATADFEIRQGTLSVSAEAFKDNKTLKNLTMYAGIREINKDAFLGCDNLDSVIFHGKFADWLKINFACDHSNPAHLAPNLSITEAESDIVIPEGITAIPNGTFRDTAITRVDIPETVTYIGAEAFKNCAGLAEIVLHGGITEIGAGAFDGTAYYAEDGNWESGALYIYTADRAISYLVASKQEAAGETVNIRTDCKVIADRAFYGNTVLTTVTAGDGLYTIGESAFENCSALANVTIGTGLRIVFEKAFYGCNSLANVTFAQHAAWMATNGGGASRVKTTGPSVNLAGEINRYSYGKWNFLRAIEG